jgi:hypothetical protein
MKTLMKQISVGLLFAFMLGHVCLGLMQSRWPTVTDRYVSGGHVLPVLEVLCVAVPLLLQAVSGERSRLAAVSAMFVLAHTWVGHVSSSAQIAAMSSVYGGLPWTAMVHLVALAVMALYVGRTRQGVRFAALGLFALNAVIVIALATGTTLVAEPASPVGECGR